jgi:SAM-dependent methyltransferase
MTAGEHTNGLIGPHSDQDRLSHRIYNARHITRLYRSESLDAAETMALLAHQPAFAGRDVLDLGVGTGRTTRYLAPLARQYVCVDSSPQMVEHVRTHLPGIAVHLADVRRLSAFTGGSFDFVFAACNLIDAVSHDDRLQVLEEIRRVLRPSGVLGFSSHNRRFRSALSGPRLVRSHNPATQALHGLRYVRSLVNHVSVGRLRRIEETYALLNDPGHDYAVLHYYIDSDTQRAQLTAAGFQLLDIFDLSGRLLRNGDDDRESSSLFYVALRRD